MKNQIVTDLRIQRHPRGGYGQYQITGKINGQTLKAHTTNSEAFDWLDDDSNPEKHSEAIEYCQSVIIRVYENQF